MRMCSLVLAAIGACALAVGCGGGAATGTVKPENAAAVDVLQEAIDTKYSYRDRLGLDWPSLFDSERTDIETASTPQEFAGRTAELLRSAKDVHIWLDVEGGHRVATERPPRDVNFNKDVLRTIIKDVEQHGPCMATGRIDENIGYPDPAVGSRKSGSSKPSFPM